MVTPVKAALTTAEKETLEIPFMRFTDVTQLTHVADPESPIHNFDNVTKLTEPNVSNELPVETARVEVPVKEAKPV